MKLQTDIEALQGWRSMSQESAPCPPPLSVQVRSIASGEANPPQLPSHSFSLPTKSTFNQTSFPPFVLWTNLQLCKPPQHPSIDFTDLRPSAIVEPSSLSFFVCSFVCALLVLCLLGLRFNIDVSTTRLFTVATNHTPTVN